MNIPSLPDNVHKLFLLLGIAMLGFSYFESEKNAKEFTEKSTLYLHYLDSVSLKQKHLTHDEDILKRKAEMLSTKYGIKNPLQFKDSVITFSQVVVGPPQVVAVNDSISKLYYELKEKLFEFSLGEKKMYEMSKKIELLLYNHNNPFIEDNILIFMGIIFILLGYGGYLVQQNNQDELMKRQLAEKPQYYKYCQSCGKIFSSIRKNGTEANGNKNVAFCFECYKDGSFTEPDLSLDIMKARTEVQIRARKKIERYLVRMRINKLERWKKHEYF